MNYSFESPYELVRLERYSKQESIIFSKRLIKAGHRVPVHWHDFNELEIVLSGNARHIMNDREYPLTPGSAYIMSSCDFHSISVAADEDMIMLNLSVAIGGVDPSLESCFGCGVGSFRCQLSEAKLCYVSDLFDRALSEDGGERFSEIMKRSLAEELIISVMRGSPESIRENVPPLVHRAIVALNEGFRSSITLSKVAESLYVSPNHLGSCFKSAIGMSFNRYLNLTRLRFACGLLATSSKAIKEISAESGFDSSEYFLSVFKKYLGMTPSEWRGERVEKSRTIDP